MSNFVGSVDIEVRVGSDPQKEEQRDGAPGVERLEEGEDGLVSLDSDEATFLALQYPKELPKSFYKSSDPEWQEFVKLSRDNKRKKEVRNQLAGTVAQSAASNKQMQGILGKDIKWTRLWLDFTYPDQMPPEYARTG